MDPSHFATLRDKFKHAEKFQSVWEYFLDHIANDDEFNRDSHRTRSEFLEPMFQEFCKSTIGQSPDPKDVLLVRYGKEHFIHGGAAVGPLLVNVMFFEDLMVGLFCVTDPFGRKPNKFARFTAKPVPGAPRPEEN
jgi:hypothetical protein